jgi:thiol-disulfide isomerase/thioredoxin
MSLADDSMSTIAELAGGKMALVDFWTTKCVRCPMAIQKLEMAAANPKYADTVKFFTICCDVADVAKEIVEEEEWENMTHTFMALDKKEECKEYFGFKSVPHYVLINKAGVVVHNVSTKFELSTLDELVAADDSVAATPTKAAAASAVSPAAESPSSPLAPLEIDVGVEAAAAPDQSEMSEAEKEEVNRLRNGKRR